MRYLKNRSGRIESEATWRKVCNDLWDTVHKDAIDVKKFPKPPNAWERFFNSQRLEEVQNEQGDSYSFDGVF